jgi:hypothetical protein
MIESKAGNEGAEDEEERAGRFDCKSWLGDRWSAGSNWRETRDCRVQELFQLMVDGQLLFFAAFLFKAEQKPFSGRIIIFDLQVHDGADPGEGVGKDPEQSAVPKAGLLFR